MADVSEIGLDGVVYDVKDAVARQNIAEIQLSLSGLTPIVDSQDTPYLSSIQQEGTLYTLKDLELRQKVNNIIEVLNNLIDNN